jgi:para-nitrobenzyl esterase
MDLLSDELFRSPGVQVAERRAAAGHPAWVYQFDLPSPAHQGQLAAAHCLELPFAFHNFDSWSQAPFVADIAPAVRDGLAETMHRAWISFVRTGDPNHPGLPHWPRYDRRTRATMRFDSVVGSVGDLAGRARLPLG